MPFVVTLPDFEQYLKVGDRVEIDDYELYTRRNGEQRVRARSLQLLLGTHSAVEIENYVPNDEEDYGDE